MLKVEKRNRDTTRFCCLVLMALLPGAGCGLSSAPSQTDLGGDPLQEAENAFFKLDLKTARALFEKALNEPSRPAAERAEAARHLARIAWRFQEDWAMADEFLGRAEELAPGEFETPLERARLLASQGRLAEAATTARQARPRADTREERILCDTTLGDLIVRRARSDPKSIPELGSEIRSALDPLLPIVRGDPGRLETAHVALSLSLTLDDGPAALASWRAYYQVPSAVAERPTAATRSDWDYPMMGEAHESLSRLLPDWRGASAPPEDRTAVVLALAASKFFAEAAWLASDPRAPGGAAEPQDPAIADVVAYQEFLERVEQLAQRCYRLRALGETARPGLDEQLLSAGRSLWERLRFSGERPPWSDRSFWREISQRFGAQLYFRSDGGGRAFHLGHRVIEERREVEQYGRKTTVHFVALDLLASNGYSSWFWAGQAATGGWVDRDGTVVQVRSSYSSMPLEAWSQLSDPESRERLEQETREKSAGDDARARNDPAAYLPGLALRLKQQSLERLLAGLRARGLRDQELKAEFVAELGRLVRASSIFAHEGRHALEKQNLPLNWTRSGAEKEFLAKLSEVGLAPDPRLALIGGILSANIGDGSSHGQANQRILRGVVAWMEEHASEIPALDASRPLLPQLDRLSDEQLRQAVRSMDPWAP